MKAFRALWALGKAWAVAHKAQVRVRLQASGCGVLLTRSTYVDMPAEGARLVFLLL